MLKFVSFVASVDLMRIYLKFVSFSCLALSMMISSFQYSGSLIMRAQVQWYSPGFSCSPIVADHSPIPSLHLLLPIPSPGNFKPFFCAICLCQSTEELNWLKAFINVNQTHASFHPPLRPRTACQAMSCPHLPHPTNPNVYKYNI